MNRLVTDLQTGRSSSGSPKGLRDEQGVRQFQRKLYRKAKQEQGYKFYVHYDKVRVIYFLREAYRRVRLNGGARGVDGVDFQDIEERGQSHFLDQIQQELEQGIYRGQAVLRKYIPKATGKLRPLGIPTIRDRVVQMSLKMVIEPIFEADFEEFSYGYRPKRSAKEAIKEIKYHLIGERRHIFDADLSSYFDTIPHGKLMIALKQRIADRNILRLIKQFFKAPIKEGKGITGGKRNKTGTAQGGVISPLLGNIYLNLLDRIVAQPNSIFSKANVKMIRYADDFVLMAKWMSPAIMDKLESLLKRMELTIKWDKSRIVRARQESFDFLGLTIRYERPGMEGKNGYWNITPKHFKKKSQRPCKRYRQATYRQLIREGMIDVRAFAYKSPPANA